MKQCTFILFVIGIFVSILNSTAQSKFGRVTDEELAMTSYAEDSTASAVILHKDGKLRFIVDDLLGFQFEYTEEAKIKILKTEGLEYANKELAYYVVDRTHREEIVSLSGTTYNIEDGKVVKTKLSKENIFDEDSGTEWKVKKFTLPAAKVGSVIEYKYKMTSNFLYRLRDFYFQSSIPTDYVNFEANIPEYFTYNLNQQGYVRLDATDKEPNTERFMFRYTDSNGRMQSGDHKCNSNKYTFRGSKVPAAKNESHLWTINDYISKLAFELRGTHLPNDFYRPYSTTWEHIDSELLKSSTFGGNLKKAGWFKNDVEKGELTMSNANAIVKMLTDRVKWDETNTVTVSNLREALNKGIGNSADLNFLLVNALDAGGFDAFPVILSTRSKGRVPFTYPSVTAFNYVITGMRLDDKMYFIDAASKYGSWNILPEKCMVDQARIITEYHKSWVDLQTVSTGAVFLQTVVNFEEDEINIKRDETRSGNDALNARVAYKSYDNEDKFIESLENYGNCTIDEFSLVGADDNNAPLLIKYVEKRELGDMSDYIYYRPPFAKVYEENPFKAEKREFPINFNYIRNYMQMVDIHIPEGYEVAELPKSERMVLNDNNLTFLYTAQQQDNVIKLSQRFQVRKLMLLPADYDALKDFFTKMILKNDEQIVFKKIGTTSKAEENEQEVEI